MVKKIERFVFDDDKTYKEIRGKYFTASRISEIMADGRVLMNEEELEAWKKENPKSKAKYKEDETVLSDGAITYILELIQILEGAPKPEYHNAAMEWGNVTERDAAIKYCEMNGYDLLADDVIYTSEGGKVFFVGDGLIGCTPDLILKDRIAQIKCPESSTHLRYKLQLTDDNFKTELPDYYAQMQTEMMLTERERGDFFSFDPRFIKTSLQAHRVQVKADKDFQNKIYRKAKLCSERRQEYIKMIDALEAKEMIAA
ncbi:MAG TPA: YqaJ viral recombinase family protein [Cyclobacteriaceae bacterium]|jgi:hypothetical protein|nr:YqaJ viral recombinase family protein [Cyclobacteriaceae bacterium]